MSEPVAYLGGKYVPVSQAALHVFDLGVVGGTSVSEMARTFGHVPFLLNQHLARLSNSLEAVGFSAGLAIDELREICEKVVAANRQFIPANHDLGLIVFVTPGLNPTYVGRIGPVSPHQPTVCVHTFPLPFELWADLYDSGLHLVTVETRSIPDDVIDARIKHRSRLHWHLAGRQARSIAPAAMAVLTDSDGLITETATGNVCIVDGSTIITPGTHILKGISSDYVASLAAKLGLGFVHGPVTVDDLAHSDEAFLTSTPHCLLPVTQFNQKPIGPGSPGPIYRQLLQAWSSHVNVDIANQMRQGAADRQASVGYASA